jgi:hypothetical protein
MVTGHRTVELRSIELHRLVAERLDPVLIARARKHVEDWLAQPDHPVHPVYARRWLDLLALPVDELRVKLVEDSPGMRDLRQSTPFAGVLTDEERWSAIGRVP